jgi:hypothetical protein
MPNRVGPHDALPYRTLTLAELESAAGNSLAGLRYLLAQRQARLLTVFRSLFWSVVEFKRGLSGLPGLSEQICRKCREASRPVQLVSGSQACPFCGQREERTAYGRDFPNSREVGYALWVQGWGDRGNPAGQAVRR